MAALELGARRQEVDQVPLPHSRVRAGPQLLDPGVVQHSFEALAQLAGGLRFGQPERR